MLRNKNVMFIFLLLLLALSEAGLVSSLANLFYHYGEIWVHVLSGTGFGVAIVAIIRKLLDILK